MTEFAKENQKKGRIPFFSHIERTSSSIALKNHWDHFTARIGFRRSWHRVNPGLYALGNPISESPVFVTANYTLSFDALRSALKGLHCYILVLDTKGINVWCAAGGGKFSTDELVDRIGKVSLQEVVKHRVLILPQLSATGVAAHEVRKRSGFRVEYGPVRANDLGEYLKTHQATPEIRQVRFKLHDRLVLIPVEIVHVLVPLLIAAVVLFFAGGFLLSAGAVASVLAGAVLFPALLPWIPTPNFSTKGFVLGGVVTLPFILVMLLGKPEEVLWQRAVWALSYLLAFPPVTAFLALSFTGSTTFTSKSGVKREIYTYFPAMAWMFGGGILCTAAMILLRVFGIK